uniref:Liprin-alpha-2 n=1 Tax=Chelydra serpentina TaxID=8475 RepID=A0A8C3RNB9_CHESE
MMCEVMPTINEDTPMSQRGSQSSGSDSDSHFEQLMVNMLDERDRLLDTLRETQESLSLAQQRLQDVIYDRDSLQRQLNSALPQDRWQRDLDVRLGEEGGVLRRKVMRSQCWQLLKLGGERIQFQ